MFFYKLPCPLNFVLIHCFRVPAFDGLYLVWLEFLCLQDNFVQKLFLRLNHILVISYQIFHIRNTSYLLVCLLIINCLARSHRLLEFENIFVQSLNRLRVEWIGDIEKLRLERSKFKGRVELRIKASSFPENLALEVKDSLKFFLYILKSIFVKLILIRNLNVVIFHSLRNHLIVLVIGINHNESGSIGLQLLHHLERILETALLLTSPYFVLQCFYCLLLLSTCVYVLVLSCLNCSELFRPFFLFTRQSLSSLLYCYMFYLFDFYSAFSLLSTDSFSLSTLFSYLCSFYNWEVSWDLSPSVLLKVAYISFFPSISLCLWDKSILILDIKLLTYRVFFRLSRDWWRRATQVEVFLGRELQV